MVDTSLYEARSQEHYLRISIIGIISNNTVSWYKNKEDIVQIEGLVTGGNLNLNGNSSVRRTGSISMLAMGGEEYGDYQVPNYKITQTDNAVSINKIVKIEVGLRTSEPVDTTPILEILGVEDDGIIIVEDEEIRLEQLALITTSNLSEDKDITWHSLGIFVITDASITRNLQGWNISLNIQDQMALLNGTCGGTLPEDITHSPLKSEVINDNNESEWIETPILFIKLITELLVEYAGLAYDEIYIENAILKESDNEDAQETLENEEGAKAIIKIKSNIENDSKRTHNIVTWIGEEDLILTEMASIGSNVSAYAVGLGSGSRLTYSYGQHIGFVETDFVYPENKELSSKAGDSVTSVLDKIKKELGNYEYYYDKEGVFHFEEIHNGIQQRGSDKIDLGAALQDSYLPKFSREDIVYKFSADTELVASYSNNPQYKNVKNDFVITNNSSDGGIIKYRLTIGASSANDGAKEAIDDADSYYNNLRVYEDGINPDTWEDEEAKAAYAQLTVDKIGLRTLAKKVDEVNCLFPDQYPKIVFIPLGQSDTAIQRKNALTSNHSFVQVPPEFFNKVAIGVSQYSAYDAVRVELGKASNYCNSITLQAIPLYFLEPNVLIEVEDSQSDIKGVYQINSMSVPLTHDGLMTISASKVYKLI